MELKVGLCSSFDNCARAFSLKFPYTVKLRFKELLNKEQLGNSEPFPVTNMPVCLTNSEEIGFSEQLCDNQKLPYYKV